MHNHRLSPWCVMLLSAFVWPRVEAVPVSVRATEDTTLIETAPDNNMGAMDFFNAGTTGFGSRNRGVFRFDLTGIIPQGSTVLGASLELTVVGSPAAARGVPGLFGVHRVLQPWNQGDNVGTTASPGLGSFADPGEATWNDPWSVPGGAGSVDYVSTPSSVTTIEFEDVYFFDEGPRMTSDVQSWIDDPSANHGWMLISFDESTDFTARRFGASEDPTSAPTLFVTYQPIPEPGTLLFALMGIAGGIWTWRRSG